MGQSNQRQADQRNLLLRNHLKSMNIENTKDYTFVQKKNDESIVIKNTDNGKNFFLRTLTLTADEDSISMNKILQKRSKINCIHLCKVVASKKELETLACSDVQKLHLLLQCPEKSLKAELQERRQVQEIKKKKSYFYESQLWGMAYSLVKALKSLYLYGIVHESLSLDTIFIDEKGLIKLADPALFGLQKNYITAMKEKQNFTKILSPEILVFLDQYNFYFYEKEKSDIFILGILLLQLSSLKQIVIYDFKEKNAKFQQIQLNLNGLKNRYSAKYCSLLEWMTQIQPKRRPKLAQLLQFIDKNNSEAETSLSTTIIQGPAQPYTQAPARNLERNKTVSAFSINFKNNFEPILPVNYSNQRLLSPIVESFNPKTQTVNEVRQRNSTQESKDVFPFELVYHRVINNNDNMQRFEIQNLYKQYKNTDMFNSSCRGSVPSSSYHAKIQLSSKQIPNRNTKIYDGMGYSKNSLSKGQNLIYSHSSAFNNGSNKLSFSKNSIGDIKLVESSHFKEFEEHKKYVKPDFGKVSNVIEDINEQTSIESPYRQLTSHKNSQGKSLTSIKFNDIEPLTNKYNNELKHSQILQKYMQQSKSNNAEQQQVNQMQSRYFSQQKQRQVKIRQPQIPFQSYKSELLRVEMSSSSNSTPQEIYEVKVPQKYDKYLLLDNVINKQNEKYLSSKQIIESSSKNFSFQSSELESKLSRATPNFNEKSRRQTGGSQKESVFRDFNVLDENEVLFVQNDISEEGSVYTGYKSKLGLKERHGKLQFHDGGYYEGQWKNDKMEGYGQLYYGNGSVAYKGLWKDGCFNGHGQIFNDRPQQSSQPFNYKNFTEIGDKWLCYEGEFENDSKHGKGRITLTNGEYFEGIFDYDMIQGSGVFHSTTGQLIKGLWKDNELVESN